MPKQDLIQVRTGTAAQWTTANPVLAIGEVGFVSDTNELIIGDGSTAYSGLTPISGGGGGGSGAWADLTGDPDDNTAFNTYIADLLVGINADFATKSDSLYTIRTTTGGHTLDATDLAAINAGDLYIIENSGGGDLTIPTNATVAFSNGTGMAIRGFANIVAASVAVTVTPESGSLALPSATVSIEKKATNTWLIHNGAPSVAATDSVSGVVELATTAETTTGTDTTRAVTPAGVKAAIDALIAAAPGALNTLDELAAALGDDANFASTVTTALAAKAAHTNSAGSLTDGATIDLTATKHTLATSSATRTFTISYAGDDITMEVTLSATSSTFTFPASSLCVSEGIASGDNTLALSGVSGDKYIISVKKIGSAYYVVSKNFGQ